jgi:hypothetical protein
MRPTMIVLAVGLLSAPLSLLGAPESPAAATDFLNVADTAVTQTEVNGHLLVPAPMPTVGPPTVSRVDRLAGPGTHSMDAGPINGTPFSDTPSGTLSNGGSQVSQGDRSLSPSDGSGVTPNLGK